MPALLAEPLVVTDAGSTYERPVALEDLWAPTRSGALLLPPLRGAMRPELTDFFDNPQRGTLAVTRSMIDRVARARFGAFDAPSATFDVDERGAHDDLGRVFSDVPNDTGHWGVNYLDHALRPLLHSPPAYVLEILSGDYAEDRLATDMPENVGGVMVVRLDGVD